MTIQNLPARRDLAVPPLREDRNNIVAQRKPWLAMGLLVVAAAAEELVATLSGADAEIASTTAFLAFATAVVIGCLSRGRHMGKQLRRRFITAVWSGAAWLSYVAFTGLTLGATATLVLVGAAIGLPYIAKHRIYGRPRRLPAPSQDDYVQLWKANLGDHGKALAGSYLCDPQPVPGVGLRYTLELVPGKQNVNTVQGCDVRGALRLGPLQSVIVERHPTEAEPTCQVTVVTSSPVVNDQVWPGPDYAFDSAAGSVNMGPFVDGDGVACWSVYRSNGMFGGFIQGAPGSGKSRLLETIAVACASSKTHPTIVWFGCGQGGASSKLLRENADNVATTGDDMLEMLKQAERVMAVNAAENEAWGFEGFNPGRQIVTEHSAACDAADGVGCRCQPKEVVREGLLIIVDEFQNFVSKKRHPKADDIQERMSRISREGRKVGVALVLATQAPTLQASFGDGKFADPLRMCILEGNGVILRSRSKDILYVFGVAVDPATFPKLPGYGFLTDPMPGARSAPYRAYRVTDAAIERWLRIFTWRSLPTRQARYVGKTYLCRNDKKTARRAKTRKLLADLDSGATELFASVEEAMQEAAAAVAKEGDLVFGEMILVPAPAAPTFTPWKPASKLSAAAQAVLAVLDGPGGGDQLRKRVMEETGRSKVGVHGGITELLEKGLIEKTDHGTYRRAAQRADEPVA
jgi:predicted ATPase